VPVEGEVVLVVEGVDDPDVVVGAFAVGWRALAQLLATIATATRTIPVVARRVGAQRVARRCCPRAGRRRR
jgi:hypothetical protein